MKRHKLGPVMNRRRKWPSSGRAALSFGCSFGSVARVLGVSLLPLLFQCTPEAQEPTARRRERVPAAPLNAAAPKLPRHVIVVIGDGMQLAHEIAASRYLFGRDDGLSFHEFPNGAFVTTWDVTGYNARASALRLPPYSPEGFDPTLGYDPAIAGEAPYPLLPDTPERRDYFLNGLYPDSASTGTAMSTGQKTDYNNIGWKSGDAPEGRIELISETLRRSYGMAVGLVTTVPISHATPATFFSHNVDRFNYKDIGREILLETRPDVVIGGGVGIDRGDFVLAADLSAALASGQWTYVERTAGRDGGVALRHAARTATQEGKGLLGIFGGRDGNFESPVPSDTPGQPSVMRGSVENPTLADASVAALEVLSQDRDGFFLLVEQGDIDWSNHSNNFARMIGCMWDLDEAVRAITAFVDSPDDAVDWSNTLVLVTADHANSYMRFNETLGAGELPTQSGTTYPDAEISYGTTQHTGELVTLRARGLGEDSLLDYATQFPGLSIVDNTSVYQMSMAAARR